MANSAVADNNNDGDGSDPDDDADAALSDPDLGGVPLDRDSSRLDLIWAGICPRGGDGFTRRPVTGHFTRNGVFELDLRRITKPDVERLLCTLRYVWLNCASHRYPTLFMPDELRHFTPAAESTSLTRLERRLLRDLVANSMTGCELWSARDCGSTFCCSGRLLVPSDLPLSLDNGLFRFDMLVWWPGDRFGRRPGEIRAVSTREVVAGYRLFLDPAYNHPDCTYDDEVDDADEGE